MFRTIRNKLQRNPSKNSPVKLVLNCLVCGGSEFIQNNVLWPELIDEWQLSAEEAQYIDKQQGCVCTGCGSNLRSLALAKAIMSNFGFSGTFEDFVSNPNFSDAKVLEMNEAGQLTRWLEKLPFYQPTRYPEVDMRSLPYQDDAFDLIIHSDTLEHIQGPMRALSECYRVLKPGGYLCFTVPIVVGRMTRDRAGLPGSYHGDPKSGATDFVVHTEYGVDAWTQVLRSGFDNVSMFSVDYPTALALSARKTDADWPKELKLYKS